MSSVSCYGKPSKKVNIGHEHEPMLRSSVSSLYILLNVLDPIDKFEETHLETFNEAQERRLERMVNAYRLTGRTIFEHQEDLAVRLDVAYKGNSSN